MLKSMVKRGLPIVGDMDYNFERAPHPDGRGCVESGKRFITILWCVRQVLNVPRYFCVRIENV